MRTSIATVCLSGTLTEKLHAAAERRLRRGRDLRARPGRLTGQPGGDRGAGGPAGALARPVPAVPRRRRCHRGRVRARAAAGPGEVRPDAATGHRHHARVQQRRHRDDRRRRGVGRPAAPPGREAAAEHGVRIAFEALAWGRYVDDYRRAWRIVELADHDAVGVCLDSFHILSRGHDPAAIEEIPGRKVFFLQLADAPALSMDVLSWSRHHRLFPGEGAFDLGVVPRARPADGVRRTAVPGGVQRRLPADRGRADGAPGAPVPHLAGGPGRQPAACRRSPSRPASTSSRCGRRTPARSTSSSDSSASPSAAGTGARTHGCGPTGRRGSSATSSTPVTARRRSPPSGSRWLTRPCRPPAPGPSRRRPSTAGPSPPSRSSRPSGRPTARRCSSARTPGSEATWVPEFEGGRDAGHRSC